MSLIDTPKNGYDKLSGNPPWILNSGALNHMTGELNLMKNAKKIQLVLIDLPNGAVTEATQQRFVVLGRGVQLDKVLYVPNLHCNLVSIAKVAKDCELLFDFFLMIFVLYRTATSRTLIGVGEQRDRVYYFKGAIVR